MSKRLLPLALVLGLLAAACAEAAVPLEFGSGAQFVVRVADPLNDAGLDASMAVVDGQPYIAYFSFEEAVPEGSFPQTRPIGLPTLPGVMLATVKDGIWTRGAIAIKADIPNVTVAFNPAVEKGVGKLTPQNVTGLQLTADANGGLHAVWGSQAGTFYATGSSDPNAGTQWTVEQVSATPPYGPSIAVDANGNPWISYATTSAAGDLVVATKAAAGWTSEVAASGVGCSGCRTGIVVGGGGAPVVAYGDGADVMAAMPDGAGWSSATVETGGHGIGLAATATSAGQIELSYQTAEQTHVATSTDGLTWEAASIADVAQGSTTPARATGIAVDDQGSVTVAWYDPGTDSVAAATSADGSAFTPADLGLTTGAQGPAVATAADGSARYLAWYESGPQDLVLGSYEDVGGLAIAQPSPTPTEIVPPSTEPSTQECTKAVDGKVTVVAQGVAYTDGKCIEVPAGQPFTITFDNRDAGVQHNIQIFPGADTTGSPAFQGDLVTGAAQIDYQVPALDAGEYAFNCIVHPTMVGTVKVVGAGAGGGGEAQGGGGATGAVTVTAQNLAFDTSTITLAAGQGNTITFSNQDAGVQHNIAIYTANPADDPNAKPLFQGDLVTGPATVDYEVPPLDAGQYYFFCVVHPTMNGSVVVQ